MYAAHLVNWMEKHYLPSSSSWFNLAIFFLPLASSSTDIVNVKVYVRNALLLMMKFCYTVHCEVKHLLIYFHFHFSISHALSPSPSPSSPSYTEESEWLVIHFTSTAKHRKKSVIRTISCMTYASVTLFRSQGNLTKKFLSFSFPFAFRPPPSLSLLRFIKSTRDRVYTFLLYLSLSLSSPIIQKFLFFHSLSKFRPAWDFHLT